MTPNADLGELAGFGWSFGSGKLDPDWALAQLQALLEAGGTVDPDHMVAGQLAAYHATPPDQAVACLALLIDAATHSRIITGSRDDIRAVLAEGIHAADTTAWRCTREIINRLIARGHYGFADPLAE